MTTVLLKLCTRVERRQRDDTYINEHQQAAYICRVVLMVGGQKGMLHNSEIGGDRRNIASTSTDVS